MSRIRSVILTGILLALVAPHMSKAHELAAQAAATPPNSSLAGEQAITRLTRSIDPQTAVAPVLQVARGARVHLTPYGAGTSELHLHGYGIEAAGERDLPAVFVFDATRAGRFPVEMHLTGDLLGRTEKAVLYIEVREP